MIDEYANGGNPKHVYLFSRDGGAGKSHTNRIMEEHCREIEMPFIIWDDDDEDLDLQAIYYLIHIAEVDRVVFLRECDAPENFYAELLSVENLYIIGHGHEPEDELRGTENSFKVFDLENDYPFSVEDIQKLLREYIKELTKETILTIPDEAFEAISTQTTNPGDALNMLGAMLAVAVYRTQNGRTAEITDDDIKNCCNSLVIDTLSYYDSNEDSG
jgi:hypothetical protein